MIWNRQIHSYVIGAEFTVNRIAVDETTIGPFTTLFPNDRFDTDVHGYGTLSMRLGYALDDFLIYGTGGYARGYAKFRAISAPPGGGVVGEVKEYFNGWTAGGGFDYQLRDNLVIGIHYDFIRLNGDINAIATTGTPSNDPFVLKSHDIGMHAISARLSIKLDDFFSRQEWLK